MRLCWSHILHCWKSHALAHIFLSSDMITFVHSLDPDQDQGNVKPDLDPNCLTLFSVPERFFFKKSILKKSADDNKSMKHSPICKII